MHNAERVTTWILIFNQNGKNYVGFHSNVLSLDEPHQSPNYRESWYVGKPVRDLLNWEKTIPAAG